MSWFKIVVICLWVVTALRAVFCPLREGISFPIVMTVFLMGARFFEKYVINMEETARRLKEQEEKKGSK